MIGIMLLGAWFLVHQHCCVADVRTSSRNNLVDHLMRRSPLEKNFMRYGRSWPPSNLIHSSVWHLDKKMDKPEKKGKTGRDIMRFGRSMWAPLGGTKGSVGYKHLYPSLPESQFRITKLESPGLGKENNKEEFRVGQNGKYFQYYQPEGLGIIPDKKNFIRFGRNFKQLFSRDNEFEKVNQNLSTTEQDPKQHNWDKLDRTIDEETYAVDMGNAKDEDPQEKRKIRYNNCMTYVKKSMGTFQEQNGMADPGYVKEEEQLHKHTMRDICLGPHGEKLDHAFRDEEINTPHTINSDYDKEQGKSLNNPTPEDVVRSRSFGFRFGGLVPPLTLDATSFMAPEFLLLPNIPHQRNPNKRANNFIRLG